MQSQSEKIKVLFILTALHQDGAVLSTLTTIRHLDRRFFQPSLFVLKQSESEIGTSWSILIKDLNVIYGQHPGEKMYLPAVIILKRLYRYAHHHDIIIGGLEMAPTFLAVLVGKLLRKPSAGFIRNSLPELLNGLPSYYRTLTRTIYPYLTRAIAISDGIKRATGKLIPRLKGRISTVYIPIDLERIRKLGQLPLPSEVHEGPYVLGVGRLMPQKGFDILLNAYARARARGLRHRLVIVGEGRERINLEKLVKSLGLEGTVALVGFQQNPYSWMKNADMFISSSRFEGFCRVLAEAQALGTPVVSTNCPDGPAEVLQNGSSGILVENESPEALADGIMSLISSQEKMKEFSGKGLERVEEFTLRRTIGNLENILNDIYRSRYR
jgi:glycosyltransferase involved in cell wall biosynthesis